MSRRLAHSSFESAEDQTARALLAELRNVGISGELPPEPELKLMAMILEDAINCYLRFGAAKSATGEREFRDAERWLFSERSDWIFSCENICSHLGVAPSFVRARLLKGRAANYPVPAGGAISVNKSTVAFP